MASVPPQVTQISVLGSTSWWRAGLFRQRLPEVLRAEGHGVLMGAVVGGFGQRVGQLLRRVEIREAPRQVDGIVLVVDAGHPADDRVGEGADAVA